MNLFIYLFIFLQAISKNRSKANLSFALSEEQSESRQELETTEKYKQFRNACLYSKITYSEKTVQVKEGYRFCCI